MVLVWDDADNNRRVDSSPVDARRSVRVCEGDVWEMARFVLRN